MTATVEMPAAVTSTEQLMRRAVRELLERVDYAESMRRRAVQDAITSVLAGQWKHRAETFEWAAPRAGDYPGAATAADLAEATERCAAVAFACRALAAMLDAGWLE